MEGSGHDILWIDVFDNGARVEKINWVEQTVNWKRKLDYPGRAFIKKRSKKIYDFISSFTERKLEEIFEEKLLEFEPDVVQSFVLFSACAPILNVMKKYPDIKWIYSAWGNDLYYFQHKPKYLEEIKNVLPRVDFMFADCKRDFEIAKKYNFQGEFLGSFPGGGGFEINEDDLLRLTERKIILIKGYQELFGECIPVLKAVERLQNEIRNYEVVVFGAEPPVIEYLNQSSLTSWKNFRVFRKIGRGKVMKLLGQSRCYIGNSISDGMPNTLLEAIMAGAFPIQSNPGGATAEIITHNLNGLLISDPFDAEEIIEHIKRALTDDSLVNNATSYNFEKLRPVLERDFVKKEVLKRYREVENKLKA